MGIEHQLRIVVIVVVDLAGDDLRTPAAAVVDQDDARLFQNRSLRFPSQLHPHAVVLFGRPERRVLRQRKADERQEHDERAGRATVALDRELPVAVKAEAGNVVLVKVFPACELQDRSGAQAPRPSGIERRLRLEHERRRESARNPEPIADASRPHVDETVAAEEAGVGLKQFREAFFQHARRSPDNARGRKSGSRSCRRPRTG